MTVEEISAAVELDAREFGLHIEQGGWRMGLLVARNVEPGEGDGTYRSSSDRTGCGKVSATWFAERSHTSHNRVLRYYRAWERYAAKGKVPPAAELHPGDEPALVWDHLPVWTLSEIPREHGASGPLNLTVKLGQFGDRLKRSHQRFVTFIEKDLAGSKREPSSDVRDLAGRYAAYLENEVALLRAIEAGRTPTREEVLHW